MAASASCMCLHCIFQWARRVDSLGCLSLREVLLLLQLLVQLALGRILQDQEHPLLQ